MRVIFRSDASRTIGHGHVMRNLALAEALRAEGSAVSFVCREHPGHVCDVIEARGFPVSRLAAPAASAVVEDTPVHATWLGTTWDADAEQTREAVRASGASPDWLVVDHYAIDARWQGAVRSCVQRLMVIDDLADRDHDCDLLLDQNFASEATRYARRVPASCRLLLGPEYALLDRGYGVLHDRVHPREGSIRRILVSFGAADDDNVTGRVLAAFLRLNRPDIDIDVVVSGDRRGAEPLLQAGRHRNVHVHHNLPTLTHLIAAADLAIGGGGVTSIERICLGLPSLIVITAENQRPQVESLARRGLIRPIGHKDDVDELTLSKALASAITEGIDAEWSNRCLASLDGKGASRVSAILTLTEHSTICARPARLEDQSLLLQLANDPVTRDNAFSTSAITAAEHERWFHQRLGDVENSRVYVTETPLGVPVGVVRFDRVGDVWHIDYGLLPDFRGRRLGRQLLEVAMRQLKAEYPAAVLVGRVKHGNRPSCRVFEALGFAARPHEPYVEYRRVL
jgi:UDP-2,4-diacetamido-2,4,6-trideoxy-beta-L-altropyranose hydrolase